LPPRSSPWPRSTAARPKAIPAWRDLAVRKRKTEVDAQIGIIAEIGREMGVATPTLERLVALIHAIEDGRRPLAWSTLDAMLQP
jgi:2-dehydropantoate 2-reductase